MEKENRHETNLFGFRPSGGFCALPPEAVTIQMESRSRKN